MHKFSYLIFCLFILSSNYSQVDSIVDSETNYVSERDSKYAVSKILYYCGLEPNFEIVEDGNIKNAVAYIRKRKRFVKYNPDFLKRITDSTETDWSAWSVLAHEIGHHLLGHTVEKYTVSYNNELSADKFSGFILQKMGASLEESLRCIESEGNLHGSKTHPPKSERIEAISLGWNQAADTHDHFITQFTQQDNSHVNENFTHRIRFNNEMTSYYINQNHKIIWYDNYANAILISTLKNSVDNFFEWDFVLEKSNYGIDQKGNIWLKTTYGSNIMVGETEPIL